MRGFYVAFLTPLGPTGWYVPIHNDKHFHDPEINEEFRKDAARKVTIKMGGQMCKPEMVLITYVEELDEDVCRARWPQLFEKVEEHKYVRPAEFGPVPSCGASRCGVPLSDGIPWYCIAHSPEKAAREGQCPPEDRCPCTVCSDCSCADCND